MIWEKEIHDYEIIRSISYLSACRIESVPNTANSPHKLEEEQRFIDKKNQIDSSTDDKLCC